MENTKNKLLVVTLIVLILSLTILIGGIFYFKKASRVKVNQPAQTQSKPKQESVNAGEKMEKSLTERTDFIGVVKGWQKPKDSSVVFLNVEADLIEKDKVKDLDYASEKAVNMPMVRKKFKVAVDESTKLNVSGIDKIQLGDLVKVTAPKSVYETDYFTAVTLDVLPKLSE